MLKNNQNLFKLSKYNGYMDFFSTMFRPHEGARLYTRVLLESQEGRGIGMFAKDEISCGEAIMDEVNIDKLYLQL